MSFFFNQTQKSEESNVSSTPFFSLNPPINYSIFNSNYKEEDETHLAYNIFNCPEKGELWQKEKSIISQLQVFEDDDDDQLLEVISKHNRNHSNTIDKQKQSVEKIEPKPQEIINNKKAVNNQIKSEITNLYDQSLMSFSHQPLSNFSKANEKDQRRSYKEIETAPLQINEPRRVKEDHQQKLTKGLLNTSERSALEDKRQEPSFTERGPPQGQKQKTNVKMKLSDLLKPKQRKQQQPLPKLQLDSKKSPISINQTENKQSAKVNNSLSESRVRPFFNNESAKEGSKQRLKPIFEITFTRSRATDQQPEPNNKPLVNEKWNMLRRSRVDNHESKLFPTNPTKNTSSGKPQQHQQTNKAVNLIQESKPIQKTLTKPINNEHQQLQKMIKNQEQLLTCKQKKNYGFTKKDMMKMAMQEIKDESSKSKSEVEIKLTNNKPTERPHLQHEQKSQKSSVSGQSGKSSVEKEESMGLKDQLKLLGARRTERLQIKSIAPFKLKEFRPSLQLKKKQTKFGSVDKVTESRNLFTQPKPEIFPKQKQGCAQLSRQKSEVELEEEYDRRFQQKRRITQVKIAKAAAHFGRQMFELMELQRDFEQQRLRSFHMKNVYGQLAILGDTLDRRVLDILEDSHKRFP